jgi:hypothetical protein
MGLGYIVAHEKSHKNLKNLPISRDNPLNCSCQNKWLYDFQVGTTNQSVTSSFLNLPTIVTLRRPDEDDTECNIKCPTEEIKLQVSTLVLKL